MAKEWIRNFQARLIGGYFGVICFILVAKILGDSWNLTFWMVGGITLWTLMWLAGSEIFIQYFNKENKPLVGKCSCPVPGRNYCGAKVEAFLNGRLKYDKSGKLVDTQCRIHKWKIGS